MDTYTYDEALKKLLDTKRNVLITGPGGTGKTTLIKDYIEKTSDKVILCATTGTAAVNIGGETCHRVFGIPVPAYGLRVTSKQDRNINTVSRADSVVIDEISMCTNDTFSFLWRVLKKAEKVKGSKIRLIVVGDFLQLPPVVTKTGQKMLKSFGIDPSGWCFACKEWTDAHFMPIELSEIKRQNEKEYIDHLNMIRRGDVSGTDWFSDHIVDEYNMPTDAVYICGTNAEADRINSQRLSELKGTFTAYQSEKSGRVTSPPADNIVALKPNERVMFTVNSMDPGLYQNGLMGTVISCHDDNVIVKSDDGRKITVYPHTWHIYRYSVYRGCLEKEETGLFCQMPLKPAYAITIHKSQGKTFDKAVIAPESFAPGQLYVALSRVKSSEGLYLTDTIKPEYVKADSVAAAFINSGYEYVLPKKTVKKPVQKKQKKTSAASVKSARKKKTTKTAVSGSGTVKRRTSVRKTARKKVTVKSGKRTTKAAKSRKQVKKAS